MSVGIHICSRDMRIYQPSSIIEHRNTRSSVACPMSVGIHICSRTLGFHQLLRIHDCSRQSAVGIRRGVYLLGNI